MKLVENSERIAALAWAARERGTTYGNLSASLKPGEEYEICQKFRAWKRDQLQKRKEEWDRKMTDKPKVKKKRRSSGARTFDEEKAMELYRKGMSDGEIAGELGVKHNTTIHSWRKRRELPANHKPGGAPATTLHKEETVCPAP